MILVIGGAYQGKLDYIMQKYPGKVVYQCAVDSHELDLSADVINSYHLLVLAQMRMNIDAVAFIRDMLPKLCGKTIVCDDISSGVVPIDSEARLWRETVGRCLTLLAKNADEVIRVFCGIEQRLK